MARFKEGLRAFFLGMLLAVFAQLAFTYGVGVWYNCTGPHEREQAWLNRAIKHCERMRAVCKDPDLCGILDYTIARYNRIGGFDVAIIPCFSLEKDVRVIGINMPPCPGITIDPEVMDYPIQYGSMVVVHEAMHDYFPYWGHGHINERERKFYELSYKVF